MRSHLKKNGILLPIKKALTSWPVALRLSKLLDLKLLGNLKLACKIYCREIVIHPLVRLKKIKSI